MNPAACWCLAFALALAGCGGPLGNWKPAQDTVGEVNSGSGRQIETIVRDGVEYRIERSAAHPAFSWAVGPNRLGAVMNDVADNIDYATIHTLEGNRYRFLKECAGEAMVYHPSVDPTLHPVTFRILEYTDQTTVYVLRDEDMYGKKFRNYIVVASWLRPAGNRSHWIEQRTNRLEEVEFCRQ
jgi:hypothetical protein